MLFMVYLLMVVSASCAQRKAKLGDYKCGSRGTANVCGSVNPNNNVIDLRESQEPGPFRDLTTCELKNLRGFLERDPNIRASSPENATLNSSYIYTADLLLPPKTEVLRYLDNPEGPQPIRRARAVVFRGDKNPPVAEEYVCSPLPDVQKCELLNLTSRRNPVEFNFRPEARVETVSLMQYILSEVERQVGYILQESYGATFFGCENKTDCLTFSTSPLGSGLTGEPQKRLNWLLALYNLPYSRLHPLDFAILVDSRGNDPTQWSVEKIWYANRLFQDFDDLIENYNNGNINKTRITKPTNDKNLFSTLHRRGEFVPPNPQRPPTIVEPDGKRYSVKDRKVEYLGWTFDFRLSSLTGPAIYDVRFKGNRIAYELALSEIAVFYSGYAPQKQTSNFVDSSLLLGVASKALVPGADCPDSATLISSAFMSQTKSDPAVYKASMCLFEHNNGYPLRRHSSYTFKEGSFYGGMQDYVLILRAALVVGNYDYITDFIFHAHGVIEGILMSTGYVQGVFYTDLERPYGFHIQDNFLANIHDHFFSIKADIDIEGTSNRYETLDITQEQVTLKEFPGKPYSQIRFTPHLKRTELEAVHDYNFERPKYHVVHNEAKKSSENEIKAYRIHIEGMSKNLLTEGLGNEKTISWARHQMVVTKHKDDEISSSSIYGMYDSFRPVVDFTSYYTDNETIVDKDLVFWLTCGVKHIPHTEDLPVVPTVGGNLHFFLMPYNYFPECPSMGSRDAIYADHIDPANPALGVKVERYGNSREQCMIPKPTLEEDVAADPDRVLQSRNN